MEKLLKKLGKILDQDLEKQKEETLINGITGYGLSLKKEVDFLVTIDQKPWFAVEVKLNDTNIAKPIHYFKDKLEIPFCYQVVQKSGVDNFKNGIRVVSADRFLLGLR